MYNESTHTVAPPTATIKPYTGQFGRKEVIHLLRRTMFGVKKIDIWFLEKKTLTQAVDMLLRTTPVTPLPPLVDYISVGETVGFGQTWINTNNNSSAEVTGNRVLSWRNWWYGLLLQQEMSITEKLTIFWHNHFVVESETSGHPIQLYNYVMKLRQHGLGNFKVFTKAITLDASMLVYLNGQENNKEKANENYARELQELFTVGKGMDSKYTEADVKAAAQILTGYMIENNQSIFNPSLHDTSDKQFSAFYGNRIIKGQTGANGAKELDELLDMIFANPETAKFICRRLYLFFGYYDLTPQVEAEVIAPLAEIFRNNNYEIKPVLQAFFTSEHFFGTQVRGAMIKSPFDFTVGLVRQMEVAIPRPIAPSEVESAYFIWHRLNEVTIRQQQQLGSPPNVAGWAAYYQAPQFHEMWINGVTLGVRQQFISILMSGGYVYKKVVSKADVLRVVATFDTPTDPNRLVDEAIMLFLGIEVTPSVRAYMKSILLSNQQDDNYWRQAWIEYVKKPNDRIYRQIIESRLQAFFTFLLNLEEMQVS
jgi:uncharacterized protein (DUF1800 family)